MKIAGKDIMGYSKRFERITLIYSLEKREISPIFLTTSYMIKIFIVTSESSNIQVKDAYHNHIDTTEYADT